MCEAKPEDPAKAFTEADGKKQCGLCAHKAITKAWVCTRIDQQYVCPSFEDCDGFEQKPEVLRNLQPKAKGLEIPKGIKFLYLGRPGSNVIFIGPKAHKQAGSRDHEGVVTVA